MGILKSVRWRPAENIYNRYFHISLMPRNWTLIFDEWSKETNRELDHPRSSVSMIEWRLKTFIDIWWGIATHGIQLLLQRFSKFDNGQPWNKRKEDDSQNQFFVYRSLSVLWNDTGHDWNRLSCSKWVIEHFTLSKTSNISNTYRFRKPSHLFLMVHFL